MTVLLPQRAQKSKAENLDEVRLRFERSLPSRPYCSDNPKRFGVRIRRREQALRHPYVQPNAPWCERYLSYDVDHEGAAFAADDAGLPTPTYTVVNPMSAHAHIVYELARPVFPGYSARADFYLAAVKGGVLRMLGADPNYRGLLVQNPVHPRWNVWTHDVTYTLDGLANEIPQGLLKPAVGLQEHPLEVEVGRNCDLFNRVRWRAYTEVRYCTSVRELYEVALGLCHELNLFTAALPVTELRSIARSITKWTWRHRDQIRKWRNRGVMNLGVSGLDIRERQQLGARYVHTTRVRSTSGKIEAAIRSIGVATHPTITQIAKTAGISRPTVYTHLSRFPLRGLSPEEHHTLHFKERGPGQS